MRSISKLLGICLILALTACGGGGGGGGGGGDTTAPTVTFAPAMGSELIPTDVITLVFSEPMDQTATVLSGSLADASDDGQWQDNKTLKVSPTTGWLLGEATLTVTGKDPAGNVLAATTVNYQVVGQDDTPDTFSFSMAQDYFPGAVVVSQAITVAGIDIPASISIDDGEYAVNGGDFTAAGGTVNSGDQIVVRLAASAAAGSTATATLTIGGVSAGFTVETGVLEFALDEVGLKRLDFSWNALTGAASYQVLVNPDGVSGFAPAGELLAAGVEADSVEVPVHLTDWNAAQYAVEACDAGGVCVTSEPVALANAYALQAIGRVTPEHPGVQDNFGWRVALSADNGTLAVSAYSEDGLSGNPDDNDGDGVGAVYVFVRNETGGWTQQAYLKASNRESIDFFGYSLAISADGDTVAVGTIYEDSAATGVNGDGAQADNSATSAGAVYVFARDEMDVWTQQAYIKASNTAAYDEFGTDIVLSADGKTLAVGAPGEDSGNGNQVDNGAANAGAVYVFARDEVGAWAQQAYVKAGNIDTHDQFGNSVALTGDGNTLAVGAKGEDGNAGNQYEGAVYVFQRDGAGVWAQSAYIKASNPDQGDWFGYDLDISNDGKVLAVSALYEDSGATGVNGDQADNSLLTAGAVYVFVNEGLWTQKAYIKASNPDADDRFGFSVALSGDGNVLAVGASDEKSAATGVNGDQADNSTVFSGAVYVYVRDFNGDWSHKTYLKATEAETYRSFGYSAALNPDGSTLIVGGRGAGIREGAIYVH